MLDGYPYGYLTHPGDPKGSPYLGNWPHNLGDAYVGKALANLLDIENYYVITREAPKAAFDIINSECSAIVVLAQNALRYGWFEEHLPVSYLKKIKIPMVLISLGVQFRYHEEIRLSVGDIESLQWLHANSASSQVRGHISAELLASVGIKNARVLGCPSLLAANDIAQPLLAPTLDNSAYLLTDMGALPDIHHWQFRIIEQLEQMSQKTSVVCQGGEYVLQDYIRARDGDSLVRTQTLDALSGAALSTSQFGYVEDSERSLLKVSVEKASTADLEASVRWYYRDLSDNALDTLVKGSISAATTSELRRYARDWSVALSSRLHGGILALNEGTPTAFAVHDYRLQELVELYRLPNINFDRTRAPDIEQFFADLTWPDLAELRTQTQASFRAFFDENNVPHTLPQPSAGEVV